MKNKIEINAILMGSSPGDKKIHAFPMGNLDGWSNFVSTVVGRYKDRIHRAVSGTRSATGGFNDGKHTTTDYASSWRSTTYAAAKKAGTPRPSIGLDGGQLRRVSYLNQAILAMAKGGGKAEQLRLSGCIHPV